MSFPEFVLARLGEDAYVMLMEGDLFELSGLDKVFEDALREYYFTGGMPEVVNGSIDGRDTNSLRDMQKRHKLLKY